MIKLICADIDGTLLDDEKRLSERNCSAIRRAADKGICFSLVSGRMPNSVNQLFQAIGRKGPYSVYNGGALYDAEDHLLEETRLDCDVSKRILALSRQFALEGILFDGDEWYLESREGLIYSKKRPIYMKECIICPFEKALSTFKSNKYLLYFQERSSMDSFMAELRSSGLGDDMLKYYPCGSFLELMDHRVNKGNSVHALCNHFGFAPDEVMAIGDDYNDIEMLCASGLSVAMGNAFSEVKREAEFQTDSNNDDGLAKAIERFCL